MPVIKSRDLNWNELDAQADKVARVTCRKSVNRQLRAIAVNANKPRGLFARLMAWLGL